MRSAEIFILSVALGMDLFSVAILIGMNRIKRSIVFRASVVFAVFHIVMLLAGYYIGRFLGAFVDKMGIYSGSSVLMMENCASIVGAAVLVGLGVLMLQESFGKEDKLKHRKKNPLKGWTLLVLAFSVSVDALAAGFGFGMMEVDLIKLNIILGSVIFAISAIGLSLGKQVSKLLGEHSEQIGGIVLILLGGNMLWGLIS
ncbi:MAG: rane protein yebN [Firmicutes bacterium]|nr:rane protein yebN [Bacillota bacterium]